MFIYPSFDFFYFSNLILHAKHNTCHYFELSNQVVHHVIERFKRYFNRNTRKTQFIAQLKITTYKSVNISSKLYFLLISPHENDLLKLSNNIIN